MNDNARETYNAYMRNYRKKNPERIKQIQKKYWEKKMNEKEKEGRKMIDINITGKVKKILWKSNNSMKFLIEKDNKNLQGTITHKRMELADKIQVGKEYKFVGDISAYITVKEGKTYATNSFYIQDIQELSQ